MLSQLPVSGTSRRDNFVFLFGPRASFEMGCKAARLTRAGKGRW
jgi:hypothetical protein